MSGAARPNCNWTDVGRVGAGLGRRAWACRRENGTADGGVPHRGRAGLLREAGRRGGGDQETSWTTHKAGGGDIRPGFDPVLSPKAPEVVPKEEPLTNIKYPPGADGQSRAPRVLEIHPNPWSRKNVRSNDGTQAGPKADFLKIFTDIFLPENARLIAMQHVPNRQAGVNKTRK